MFPILLGLECEGDIVLLVGLELVRGQPQSLDTAALLELQCDRWLLLLSYPGQHSSSWTLVTSSTSCSTSRCLSASSWFPLPVPLLLVSPGSARPRAGDPRVGVGGVVAPVGRVGAPAGVSAWTCASTQCGHCAAHAPGGLCVWIGEMAPRLCGLS